MIIYNNEAFTFNMKIKPCILLALDRMALDELALDEMAKPRKSTLCLRGVNLHCDAFSFSKDSCFVNYFISKIL